MCCCYAQERLERSSSLRRVRSLIMHARHFRRSTRQRRTGAGGRQRRGRRKRKQWTPSGGDLRGRRRTGDRRRWIFIRAPQRVFRDALTSSRCKRCSLHIHHHQQHAADDDRRRSLQAIDPPPKWPIAGVPNLGVGAPSGCQTQI